MSTTGHLPILIRENRRFLAACLLFWAAGIGVLLLEQDDTTLQIAFKPYHNNTLDTLWRIVTYLGSGGFFVCMWLAGALFSKRYAVCGLLSMALTAGLTMAIKYTVNAPRPWVVLPQDAPFVEGFAPATSPCFPSGHAATAFCLFSLLAFFSHRQRVKMLLFFIAFAVAYSRIYLMQHFLRDILAGSFIGTASAFGVFAAMQRRSCRTTTGENPAAADRYGR